MASTQSPSSPFRSTIFPLGRGRSSAAWKAFRRRAGPLLKAGPREPRLAGRGCRSKFRSFACGRSRCRSRRPPQTRGRAEFFEAYFQPNRVWGTTRTGLLDGVLRAQILKARERRRKTFKVPSIDGRTTLCMVGKRTRREIGSPHASAQDRRGLEPFLTRHRDRGRRARRPGSRLFYLKDAVDVFFMQVQGPAGSNCRMATKFGLPMTARTVTPITRSETIVDHEGHLTADEMSLKSLKKWLKADKDRANPSCGKIIPTSSKSCQARKPRRRWASTAFHSSLREVSLSTPLYPIGTPIYVDAPLITHATASQEFHRLMIAHDVVQRSRDRSAAIFLSV